MIYLDFFQSILSVFLIIFIGFIATYFGKISGEDIHAFSEVIFYITSPAIILNSIPENFSKEMILSSFSLPFFAIIVVLLSLILCWIVLKFLNIKDYKKEDIFYLTTSFSNTVFIGLPIISALYGERSIGYVFFYDLGTGILFWTVGIYLASRKSDTSQAFNANKFIKHIMNPSLVALFFSMILVLLNKKLPSVLKQPIKMLGNITIPLAMLIIGANIATLKTSKKVKEFIILPAIIIKLLIIPLLIGFILYFINIPLLVKKVIITESAMPSMISAAMLSQKFEKLPDLSSKIVIATTAMSLITIPLVIYLMELYIG